MSGSAKTLYSMPADVQHRVPVGSEVRVKLRRGTDYTDQLNNGFIGSMDSNFGDKYVCHRLLGHRQVTSVEWLSGGRWEHLGMEDNPMEDALMEDALMEDALMEDALTKDALMEDDQQSAPPPARLSG